MPTYARFSSLVGLSDFRFTSSPAQPQSAMQVGVLLLPAALGLHVEASPASSMPDEQVNDGEVGESDEEANAAFTWLLSALEASALH
jgi:hypothetical protein